jgi:CBS domain-containing protein
MKDILIQEIMTKDLVTANCNQSVSRVANIFKEHSFHHVVVTNDEGGLEGVISRTDMDRTRSGATLFKNHQKEEYDAALLHTLRVCDIMTSNIVFLQSTDPIRKAYEIFKENKFRALPVVSKDNLVGIVTPIDILDHFFK